MEKDKSREKRLDKNVTTIKKNPLGQSSFERGTKTMPNIKKTEHQPKPKPRKSSEKIKPSSPPKKVKAQSNLYSKIPSSLLQKPKPKKSKKHSKNAKIFPPAFLDKMAIRIQSVWRGYRVRRQFKEELNQIEAKISHAKEGILKPS
jgi:hypothetical protein